MRIKGLQKLTLLDYPNHVACTIFTSGCNFRCPFCHNASLVVRQDEHYIDEDEVIKFLKKRIGILDGVCISGGEPLLQPDLKEFIIKVKAMGYKVKLDTNGSFPDKLIDLIESNLIDYVAMDIKNSLEKYALTVGLKDMNLEPIKKSVAYLKEEHIPYEFRTTVVKELHDCKDFTKIGKWIQGNEKYFLQEFKDSGDLIESNLHGMMIKNMEEIASSLKLEVPNVKLRGIN